jgi:proteasome lid subunit RPN8/RPN11
MTWSPSETIVADALKHTVECRPFEACGVVADGKFYPVENTVTTYDAFIMNMRDYLKIAKKHDIEAIVHSHLYAPAIASEADRTMCEATGKPWLIVAWPTEKWIVIEPTGYRAPLVGRDWGWGSHDCYTLVCDALHDFAGLTMPRVGCDWLWWRRGEDLIIDLAPDLGLVEVDDEWRHCDIIAMRMFPSPVVNHFGVFLYPDVMLHQQYGRKSVREVYGGVWRDSTVKHYRHAALLDAAPALPEGYQVWSRPQ